MKGWEAVIRSRCPEIRMAIRSGGWRLITLFIALGCTCSAFASSPANKLTVENVMNLLSAGVSIPRVTHLVRERGVDFQLDAQLQKAFADAGADATLIQALEEATGRAPSSDARSSVASVHRGEITPTHSVTLPQPKPAPSTPPAPSGLSDSQMATVQIRSRPGGVTVWVDNEIKGTTDAEEGRLKVGGLPPGKHQLRAQRDGYEPVEGTMELAAGQAVEMPIWLAKSEAPSPAPAAPELPPGPKFRVRHKHRAIEGIAPEGACHGWMVVNVGYVRYISTDSPHKYLMNTSEMREAKPASGQGNFRIRLDYGRTYEFTAVDENGNAVSAAPVLTEIRYSMGQ